MKKLYLFCTKAKNFLTLIPPIILLVVAIIYNDYSKDPFKLYLLQVVAIIGIIFILVYFSQFIKIGYEEIRCLGLFSSKDSCLIKEGNRLVLTMYKKSNILVEIFGIDDAPALDWIDKEECLTKEINLFRARAVGGKATVSRILKYFGVDNDHHKAIFDTESFNSDYELVSVSANTVLDNRREISLTLKDTL